MCDPTIHYSILDAEKADFLAIYGDDDHSSSIPCLDLFPESGVLEFVHVPMIEAFVVTPEYVRFDARGPLDPNALRDRLDVGGDLRKLITEVRRAALVDQGLIAACRTFSAALEGLIDDTH